MSEQLGWEDLLPNRPKTKKTPVRNDLESRINKLLETKNLPEIKEVEIKVTGVQQDIVVEVQPEPEVFTVSALNRQIKLLLEKNFPFLWVKGEISNLKIPGSGHLYFTLKDMTSQIKAVMFRGFAQTLKFEPKDGMEVLVRCRVTAYEPRGDYQLFCEVMEPVGFGALQAAFEQLKSKLQSEGLFEQKKKKPIPAFPARIGIITSPTGAAIRDMLNILARRSGGGLDITILPTSVQGEKAPSEIVAALALANRMGTERFDVLIVGRGGGSIEDLWAFNSEAVARAVSVSRIPVISAVGHEVDFTICDFVSDLRAPTPSAAAELVVKHKSDLTEKILLFRRHLVQLIRRKLLLSRSSYEGFSKRLIDPKRKLQDLMLRCDELTDRLINGTQRFYVSLQTHLKLLKEKLGTPEAKLENARQHLFHFQTQLKTLVFKTLDDKRSDLAQKAVLLNGLSPLAVLDRGYSIVKKGDQIIKEADQLSKGDKVRLKFAKGEVSSEIL